MQPTEMPAEFAQLPRTIKSREIEYVRAKMNFFLLWCGRINSCCRLGVTHCHNCPMPVRATLHQERTGVYRVMLLRPICTILYFKWVTTGEVSRRKIVCFFRRPISGMETPIYETTLGSVLTEIIGKLQSENGPGLIATVLGKSGLDGSTLPKLRQPAARMPRPASSERRGQGNDSGRGRLRNAA